MAESNQDAITLLITNARDGGPNARRRLYDSIYEELRLIARGIPGIRPDQGTLQATVIVNEVFIEFERRFPAPPTNMPESRRTFYRSVSLAMRQVVRDYARAEGALKRGGKRRKLDLRESIVGATSFAGYDPAELLELDAATAALEQYNKRWAEVVMHRFYAGRSISQTAELMQRAESSISRDWALARAWLERRLEGRVDE
jgi:RNA polymerase sigma factor (TIGR02999 family)